MSAATIPHHDYVYRAQVVKVHDADTIVLLCDLGFDVRVRATVRVAGINAPELATPEGKRAQQWALGWLMGAGPDEWPLVIASQKAATAIGTEKYGRWMAQVWRVSDGTELGAALIAAGMAVFWDGHGAKPLPTTGGTA